MRLWLAMHSLRPCRRGPTMQSQDLWDHIAEHPQGVPVSAEMKAELDRRLAAHRADPSSAIPWEQVKAELRRRQ